MKKIIIASLIIVGCAIGGFVYTSEDTHASDQEKHLTDQEASMVQKIETGEVKPLDYTVEIVDATGNVVWRGSANYYQKHADEIDAKLKEKYDMIPTKAQQRARAEKMYGGKP